MEFKSSFLIIISSFIFSLLFLTKIYRQKTKVRSEVHKLPPGPWKLPLIGNLHQMAFGGSFPHRKLLDLSHKYGPLMHLQLGEISAVVVSSPDFAKEIMKTHDLSFVQRPELLAANILAYGSKDLIFAPYGDYWRQMKKICTSELLSAKRVQSFSSIREHEVEKLIQSIQFSASQGQETNLSKMLTTLISTFITRAAFGKKSKYEDELLCLLKEGVEMASGFDVADLFPSFKPIHLITRLKPRFEIMQKKLDKILESFINENQSNHNGLQGENLIDVLLRVQQSDGLEIPITRDNIKAVIWDMFGGATDTSATTLEWTMAELMKNPRVMKKVQTEIRETFKGKKRIYESDLHELSYMKSVIKETMRLHPPATLILRECIKACKLSGYEIPIKTQVIVNLWALGRDPNHWDDAEKFMPERFHESSGFDFNNSFKYMPFGGGRRICPGILFGLANMELPLAALLYHFNWEIPNGMKPDNLDMSEVFGATVFRRNDLFLFPTPYI